MRIAGASRRRMPPRRCPSRSSRSCSGSTATSPFAIASRSGKGSSNGTRRSSASATRMRSASRSSRTTPISIRPTSGTRRFAGRRWPRRRTARSARRSSIRAPAKSSTPTSASMRTTSASSAISGMNTCRREPTRSPRSRRRIRMRTPRPTRKIARTTTPRPRKPHSGCRCSKRAESSIPIVRTSTNSSTSS